MHPPGHYFYSLIFSSWYLLCSFSVSNIQAIYNIGSWGLESPKIVIHLKVDDEQWRATKKD